MEHKGTFKINCINKKTGEKKEVTIKNRIMDITLSEIIAVLQKTTNLEIKFLALGSSSNSVSTSDTKLGNEIFRTPFVSKKLTNVGEITTEFTILDTEAVGQIEEIGIFGGPDAAIEKNSGTLISRILWSKNKTNAEELNITRIDKIERSG